MSTRTCSSLLVTMLLACGLCAVPAIAQQAKPDHPPKAPVKEAPGAAKAGERIGDPYPLSTCPISGGKLGSMGDPVVKLYEGREVRFCCSACPPKFEKDLAANIAKLDEVIIKDQLPLYPLETSVVSGKKLSEAADAKPVDFVYGNRLVRVVNAAEKAEFLKDAKKHLAALDKAVIEKQGKEYPLTTCVVSGDKLGSSEKHETTDVVLAGRLVRLCCDMCMKDLKKDPAKIIAAVDAARNAAKPGKGTK